ncbi:MAG: hypothetical protein QOH06_5645 [Acidobacteriota bacterium]|jgi:hypothetical protein|nr:hypothetical protein [Acidobacteriota bacterium]
MRSRAALVVLCLLSSPASAQIVRGGALPAPLPIHPPDHWWNVDVSTAPVDTNSTSFINFIGANVGLHPDFGGDSQEDPPPAIYGMVYMTVPGTQPLEVVTWTTDWNESDNGAPGRPIGYPIPVEARTGVKWIESGYAGNDDQGHDRHMLIVDKDNRILYELYRTVWNPASQEWEADSGAIFKLDSLERRQEGWTSADAAGLAILPGLVRYDEVFGTAPIKHAFRMTVQNTNGYVWPASHVAGGTPGALPMGARLRLKASKNITGYTPQVQRIFQAMKTYGLIVADNGSNMFITGTYDTRWGNDELDAFGDLTASDFEVIQRGWKPAVGTATPALDYYTLTPCRLVDTRVTPGAYGGPAILPGQRVFVAAGQCGIPAAAKALAVNLTTINPGTTGHLKIFPGNAAPTAATAISFTAGLTRANNAMVMLSSSGSGALGVSNTTGVPVHVAIDVFGYFQ